MRETTKTIDTDNEHLLLSMRQSVRRRVAYFSQVDFASARVKDEGRAEGDLCEIWHRGRDPRSHEGKSIIRTEEGDDVSKQ